MNESNRYVNICNGEEVEMNSDEFEKSFTSFEQFTKDFFLNRNISYTINKEDVRSGTTEFDLIYNSVPYHCVFLHLKNSGMNKIEKDKYSKRMQIGTNLITYDDDIPHYVIASYNTYDKILYFIVELKDYIKNKSNDKSYSSFWIDYAFLYLTYHKGYSIWRDSKERRIVGIDNLKVKEYEDEDLIAKLFPDKIDYYINHPKSGKKEKTDETNEPEKILPIYVEDESVLYNAGLKLKRNQSLKKYAFERENYTCELCGTKNTFKNRNGEEYFEGHHLIMYNVSSQRKYKYSLDILENIICLCPMCHRKIHFGSEEEISLLIEKLINKHSDLFDIYEFDDINEILINYLNYEGDDDNV